MLVWLGILCMLSKISCIRYRAGVPESRIGTPIFSADFMSGAYASCSGVYQALGIDTRNQRKATERV